MISSLFRQTPGGAPSQNPVTLGLSTGGFESGRIRGPATSPDLYKEVAPGALYATSPLDTPSFMAGGLASNPITWILGAGGLVLLFLIARKKGLAHV